MSTVPSPWDPESGSSGPGPGTQSVLISLVAGAWVAQAQGYDSEGNTVDVGTGVALTLVAGGGKVSLSGTDLTIASGAADIAKPDPATLGTEGRGWYVPLTDLGVPTLDYGAMLRLDLLCDSRPTVAFGYVFAGLLTGAWASSAQTLLGGCLSYNLGNKALHYVSGSGNYGTLATPAADFDRLAIEGRHQVNDGRFGYRNAAGSAGGAFFAVTPGTGTVTHLGVSAGAVYGATAAACTFGNPRVRFTWSVAP